MFKLYKSHIHTYIIIYIYTHYISINLEIQWYWYYLIFNVFKESQISSVSLCEFCSSISRRGCSFGLFQWPEGLVAKAGEEKHVFSMVFPLFFHGFSHEIWGNHQKPKVFVFLHMFPSNQNTHISGSAHGPFSSKICLRGLKVGKW